jgi:hypothetical protein
VTKADKKIDVLLSVDLGGRKLRFVPFSFSVSSTNLSHPQPSGETVQFSLFWLLGYVDL